LSDTGQRGRLATFGSGFLLVALVFSTALVFPAGGGLCLASEGQQEDESPTVADGIPDSYCGIYCLYSVMKLFDVEVSPEELIRPEYVGSIRGSSLAELKKGAEAHGLYAVAVANLTSRELRRSGYPVIIHVKSGQAKSEYDHYELVLKANREGAVVYNPPYDVRLVGFRELLPRWDGQGLIVSDRPIDLAGVFDSARRLFLVCTCLAVFGIFLGRWICRRMSVLVGSLSRRKCVVLSAVQSAGLVFVALLAGFVYHFFGSEGFLGHSEGVAIVQQAFGGSFVPRLNEKRVRQYLESGTAVFVDPRSPRGFRTGHLQGAVNVPVRGCCEEQREIMAEFNKATRIVVYCDAAGCSFAEKVALRLILDGFDNVSIYRGSWAQWATTGEKRSSEAL